MDLFTTEAMRLYYWFRCVLEVGLSRPNWSEDLDFDLSDNHGLPRIIVAHNPQVDPAIYDPDSMDGSHATIIVLYVISKSIPIEVRNYCDEILPLQRYTPVLFVSHSSTSGCSPCSTV